MASQNIRRIELLRRRARSGSLKNIQELCAVTDSRTFVAHLPIFLKFLSEIRPPQTDFGFKPEEHTDSLNSTDQVALARFVLWQIALGLQPKPGTRVTEDIPSIRMPIRRSWPIIFSWLSFFTTSFVDYDFKSYDDLQPETGVTSLRTVAQLFCFLLSSKIIRPVEFRSTPGAAEMMVRIHMYVFTIRFSPDTSVQMPDRKSALEASECGLVFSDGILAEWDDFWEEIYGDVLSKLVQTRLSTIIVRTLAHFSQEERLNYRLLRSWFCALTSILAWSVSEPVFNEILHLPSIRYTSVILRRLSADASNPNRTLTPIQETSLQVVWRFALEFLYESFNYGGYTSIIPALKSGLLLTLWNLSRAAEGDPWVLHSNIASDELYINLVKLIAGSSMYRSVQRCLEKPLQTSPFSDVDIDPVVPNMSLATSTVWRDFKLLCVSRMRLRNYLETKYSFCSNDKCTTSGPRVRLCNGCKITLYCGLSCQKQHWRNGHRAECLQYIKDAEAHLPRPAQERDYNIIGCIIQTELWEDRDRLLREQSMYRDQHLADDSAVYINRIDLTTSDARASVWTLEEAKANSECAEEDWNFLIQGFHTMLRHQQIEGNSEEVGPIITAIFPHPGQPSYMNMILTRPKFEDQSDLLDNSPELDPETEIRTSVIGNNVARGLSRFPSLRMGDGRFLFPVLGVHVKGPKQQRG
ncbi:uncharacterized protein C8R40DRAFT_1114696 [Lentinula edodes]|uniref:uncharacterized protein n=1 Tax=Lentinula edodes TaxID=5353 RepID=UPI001E8D7FED|nr:uncharacterized protein C8R40DRAFT_1114696 [Lentinula edodes]KAH7873290.1 hypothetical protein C8R40DRAFT_1114696 [Lentinula edodes]